MKSSLSRWVPLTLAIAVCLTFGLAETTYGQGNCPNQGGGGNSPGGGLGGGFGAAGGQQAPRGFGQQGAGGQGGLVGQAQAAMQAMQLIRENGDHDARRTSTWSGNATGTRNATGTGACNKAPPEDIVNRVGFLLLNSWVEEQEYHREFRGRPDKPDSLVNREEQECKLKTDRLRRLDKLHNRGFKEQVLRAFQTLQERSIRPVEGELSPEICVRTEMCLAISLPRTMQMQLSKGMEINLPTEDFNGGRKLELARQARARFLARKRAERARETEGSPSSEEVVSVE